MRRLLTGSLAALLTSAAASTSTAAIVISQYYEGASNDKYVELYNSGALAVDLAASSYKLALFSNTAREGWKTDGVPNSTVNLAGTIAPGGTVLYKNSSAANPTYAATAATSNSAVNFNGDDSVVLWSNSSATFDTDFVVDVVGLTGNTAADTSYVRNSSITTGTVSDFNAADWTTFTLAAVAAATPTSNEYLGFHSTGPVPEPATAGLLGMASLAFLRRRRA